MSVPSVAKGVIAQVNPFDRGASYGTYNNGLSAKPVTSNGGATTAPAYPGGSFVDTSAYDKKVADSNAAIKALQAQLASQPRLPVYNTAQAWASAQKSAESHQNPVYQDKLNAYLQKANLERQQASTSRDVNVKGINSDLTQNLEDIGTTRTRAGEDTATTLADLTASQAFEQRTGGTAFDRARMSLLGGVADAGLTTSGLGAQQEANAVSDRNVQDAEMGRQYKGKESAANLGLARTNEDLNVNTDRAKGAAVTRTEAEDRSLKNFIDSSNLEEQATRASNEAERLAAISADTGNFYKTGVAGFIQSLIGSGARAQDIALAQQIYG